MGKQTLIFQDKLYDVVTEKVRAGHYRVALAESGGDGSHLHLGQVMLADGRWSAFGQPTGEDAQGFATRKAAIEHMLIEQDYKELPWDDQDTV